MFEIMKLAEIQRLNIVHELKIKIPDWIYHPRVDQLEASAIWIRKKHEKTLAQVGMKYN